MNTISVLEEKAVAEVKAKRPPALVPLEFKHSQLTGTPWVAVGFALRGAVTIISATGGTGKTQFTLQAAIAFALGEEFAGFRPMRKNLKIAFVSGEEPLDEIWRRIAAIEVDRVGYKSADIEKFKERLKGRLFICQGKNVALVTKGTTKNDVAQRTSFHEELCEDIIDLGIDLVILDPLIRLHAGLDENSAEMQELHNAADDIATRGKCGVVLVSHTNKMSKGTVDDQNAARGTSAMTDAARVVIIMSNMTETQAKDILPKAEQATYMRYCRLGDPKQSYTVNSGSQWFRKKTIKLPVTLEDGTDDYRFVLEPWKTSNDILSAEWLPRFIERLKQGRGDGEAFTAATDGPKSSRADALLQAHFNLSRDQSKESLDQLVSAGILRVVEKHSTKGKKMVKVYEVLKGEPAQADDELL
ncbi:AAA family ATPase [Bradyrhizobium sp. YCK136]|uniref:AAA family ATPase n=1 Tax=Bradyrhizobium TaxID=374 RepID=UPI001B8AFBF7|nr:AAA family ATPase [Bradyrhizobium diazoefficiens]MBR0864565.1 AAA family ATPase [Bradyrhizobium diazoefficiens]MBR0889140.1 AAA family ATPase [Bradyrhizobium diazoefficiens]MBR0920890.1 AAA family ATPase [Bradyrhizobium diazoefficiens]